MLRDKGRDFEGMNKGSDSGCERERTLENGFTGIINRSIGC